MASSRFRKGSFAFDTLKLMSGSTLAQVITILAAPILTRIYGPAAFGVLGLFIAVTRILTTIMNSISWQLPAFFLSYFFTATEVGFFALGNRVVELPMRIVGASIAQVFFPRASGAHHQGNLSEMVTSTFRALVTFSFFPLMLLIFIAPELFEVVFGTRWHEAGVYTKILAPWISFWFISSPMSTIFSVLEKQEWSFRINIAILTSRFIALGLGGWLGSARLMLGFFAISGVLVYGFMSLFILRLAGARFHDIMHILWEKGWPLLPASFLLLLVQRMTSSPWAMLLGALLGALLALLVYYAYQWRTEPQLRLFFTSISS